jgi:hypothetical protein
MSLLICFLTHKTCMVGRRGDDCDLWRHLLSGWFSSGSLTCHAALTTL